VPAFAGRIRLELATARCAEELPPLQLKYLELRRHSLA
jgi:hypothetical protein